MYGVCAWGDLAGEGDTGKVLVRNFQKLPFSMFDPPLAKAEPISSSTTNIFKREKPVGQLPLFPEALLFWRVG